MGDLTSFGDIRAALQSTPSQKLWEQLCRAIEQWPDPHELIEQIIPYVSGALRSWPDSLLIAPDRWVKAFLSSQAPVPYLYIARHLVVQALWLNKARVKKLVQATQLARITTLTLHCSRQDPDLLAKLLAKAPWVQTLTSVTVHHSAVGDDVDALLLAIKNMTHVRHLRLHHMQLDADKLNLLSSVLPATQLITLSLNHNPLGSYALRPLFERPLPALRTLELVSTQHHSSIGDTLYQATDLSALRMLKLGHNALGDEGLRSLVNAQYFAKLTALELEYTRISDAGVEMLVQEGSLTTLRTLNLYGNALSNESARRLARAPHLKSLEALRLELTDIDTEGWHALATSSHLTEHLKQHFKLKI